MQSTLPNNPYTPDQPIRNPGRFFGREDSLAWLAARFEQYAVAIVHGTPRIGITSLLLQACQQFSDRFQASYLALDTAFPATALQEIARVVASGVGLPPTNSPAALRQALDDSIYDTQHKPILVALDGLAAWNLTAKVELLNGLGALVSLDRRLRFVLGWGALEDQTIAREMPLRLIGMTEGLPPIAQLRLGTLNRPDLSRLLSETAGNLLRYDFQALEVAWQACNGRPHMAQMLGFAIFERRGPGGRVAARSVQLALADAAARLHALMYDAWDALTREEQLVLAGAGTVRGEHGMLTVKNLVKELAASGFNLGEDTARAALTRLCDLDIMEPAGVGGFRFSSGLVHAWAANYANLTAVTGKPRRRVLIPRIEWGARLGKLLLRVASWTLLAAFFLFVLMGGAQIVQTIAPSPTSTPAPIWSPTPTRTPVPLPTPTPVPQDVIAYMARPTDKDRWRIYTAGFDGANPRALTTGISDDQWPSWSPDGAKIAFSSNRDGNWEIYVMNRDGAEQTRLTRNGASDWAPTWSPDGKRLAFSSLRDRNWEIYVINADGSSPVRLTQDPAEDHSPVWSPDGRVLAFASKRTGNYEIYLMNPDGSQVTRLTETTANNFSPSWAPDGKRIAFESNRDGNWEIYVMNGDGTNTRNLTNHLTNDQAPAWSSDGAWISFYSNRGGASAVWVMRADGNDPQAWTTGLIAQFPVWRPTARR